MIISALLFLSSYLYALELKAGDILLQPLDCYVCQLIEDQEKSSYSHMGIVVEKDGRLVVAEALSNVGYVEIKDFKARTAKNEKINVIRLEGLDNLALVQKFESLFLNKEYDHFYHWNDDSYYCSEMIYKLLENMTDLPPLKVMLFDINASAWDSYFKNLTPSSTAPRGELGISPADFHQFYRTKSIGAF